MAPEAENEQPIIIIKKKPRHEGSHGGAWKVAYADFITALMAFFLVMWLVSQDQVIKDNIQGYFNDPANWGKLKDGGKSILKGSNTILGGSGGMPIETRITETKAREVLKRAGERINDVLTGLPDFESIKDHIEIELTEEGLRIELIESLSSDDESAYFFKLGKSELSPRGEEILTAITKEIVTLDNDIIIEGHTDSRQYLYKDKYSNWELSTDRANAARKLMKNEGLKEKRMQEIRGFAANRPKIVDNPKDVRNRRISIVIRPYLFETIELHEVINGQVVKEIN